MARPISDRDLLWLENTKGNVSGIVTRCKRLAITYDYDVEILQTVVEILERAVRIRNDYLALEEKLRREHDDTAT